MRKIKTITGKAAQEYYEELQARNVDPWINPVNWVLADVRLRFLLLMKIKPKYFHQRHRYPPYQRRLMDIMVIGSYEGDLGEDIVHRRGIVNDLRYTYLKFLYRSEFNKKHDWVRVTSNRDPKPIFVWHEDIAEYYRQKNA